MAEKFTQNSITSGYRAIQDGSQFQRYFGQPEQKDRIIIEDGEVNETVVLMKKVVWKYLSDTKEISTYLKASTTEKTAENIWNFLYHHIQYKLDKKGVEQLRRPNRSWSERKTGIDCDCFSIFVSSILTNLQIPHSFRITRYEEDYFQHVYVILPTNTSKYITIDCVLSAFDYEKPFTEKRDFTMSLNGINVAVLSGVSGINALELCNDLQGINASNPQERLNALYQHLVKTRELVASQPQTIMLVDDPKAFLKMLDYAIINWHNPKNREIALEHLKRNEDALNEHNSLFNIEENSDLEGLDTDWSYLDGLSNNQILVELSGLDGKAKTKTAKEISKSKKQFFTKVKEAVKTGGKAVVRYNPVSLAARNGFLLAMKLNLKQMASKLKWAYATQAQAAAKGINADTWNRSKNALTKIEKLFADKLQGKREKLKAAILSGKAGGLSGVGSEMNLLGLGAVVAAATLAAAIPVIAMALKILVDSGLMSKKEADNLEAEVKMKADEGEKEFKDKNTFEELLSLEKSTTASNSNALVSRNSASESSALINSEQSESPENTELTSYESATESNEENKVVGFAKRNPILVAAGLGLLGVGAYFIYKPKAKPSSLKGLKFENRKTASKKSSNKKLQVVHLK